MAKLRRRKGVNVWQARIKDENGTWISFSTGVPISLSGVPPDQLERKAQEAADAQERLRRGSSTYKREVALLRAAAVARGEAEVIPTVADFLQNFPRGKRTTDSTEKTRRHRAGDGGPPTGEGGATILPRQPTGPTLGGGGVGNSGRRVLPAGGA